MRKLILTTAAVAAAICLAGCGNSNPNTLIDNRDGKTYRTVIMPDGNRWMTQNLNYKTDSSWCYKSCNKYGRRYRWNTAMTVCPNDWHLPSSTEWDSLAKSVGGEEDHHLIRKRFERNWQKVGTKLKSKRGWYENGNGSDDYGFSALSYDDGYNIAWWTSTEINSDTANVRSIHYSGDLLIESYCSKEHSEAVRCVADHP